MNIISELGKIFEEFNEDEKCGLCWVYKPGGRSDYFNNIHLVPGEECCVYIGIVDITATEGYRMNDFGAVRYYSDWQIRMIAGIPSSLDLQFYNENDAYPIEEGKWEKYINPIFCCLDGGFALNLCESVTCDDEVTSVEVSSWRTRMVLNYRDYNLDGVEVVATLREHRA